MKNHTAALKFLLEHLALLAGPGVGAVARRLSENLDLDIILPTLASVAQPVDVTPAAVLNPTPIVTIPVPPTTVGTTVAHPDLVQMTLTDAHAAVIK